MVIIELNLYKGFLNKFKIDREYFIKLVFHLKIVGLFIQYSISEFNFKNVSM